MDISESKLREFENTLKEIRDTVLSDAAFFADKKFRKATMLLSFAFSAIIAIFCALGYAISTNLPGSPLPTALIWTAFAVLVVGATVKLKIFSGLMRQRNKTIFTLLRAIYGKSPRSVLVGAIAAVAVVSVFLVSRSRGALAVSFAAIFLSFGVFVLSTRIRLPEFLTLGWFLLASGLASLFFIEGAPWLWGGIVWAGSLFALGIAGFALTRSK